MPRFHPDILINDCWASIGDKTFYHRNGKCFIRRKHATAFCGTEGQLNQTALHHRALEAWRSLDQATQGLWHEYARSVPSQRPPFDRRTNISGYNLFVSAYHGFAQLGNEHIPWPQRKGPFPEFGLDFKSASIQNSSDLILKFKTSLCGADNLERYRFLLKLQLERPGHGRNPGLMRNFIASAGPITDGGEVCFTVKDYVGIWGYELRQFQAHCRYLILDSETGFRSGFKEESFVFSC